MNIYSLTLVITLGLTSPVPFYWPFRQPFHPQFIFPGRIFNTDGFSTVVENGKRENRKHRKNTHARQRVYRNEDG